MLCYKTIGIQTLSNISHILEPPAISLTAKQQFLVIIVDLSHVELFGYDLQKNNKAEKVRFIVEVLTRPLPGAGCSSCQTQTRSVTCGE